MKTMFRKIFSLSLLVLFVLPLVTKSVHDFGHRNDFHCSEKSSKHLHEQEHNCSLCDYQSPVSHAIDFTCNPVVLNSQPVLLDIPVLANNDTPLFFRLSSRGPPALV